jgi:hypothetical protein
MKTPAAEPWTGFDELLAKPVDLKALEATLARLIHHER